MAGSERAHPGRRPDRAPGRQQADPDLLLPALRELTGAVDALADAADQ